MTNGEELVPRWMTVLLGIGGVYALGWLLAKTLGWMWSWFVVPMLGW